MTTEATLRRACATATVVFAIFVAVPTWSQDAGWDPGAYAAAMDEATELFDAGHYERSLERYEQGRDLLSRALETGAIAEAHREPAETDLALVHYQIARVHQLLSRCEKAFALYQDIPGGGGLDTDFEMKLALRVSQTGVCAADLALDRRDVATANTYLRAGDARIEQTVADKVETPAFDPLRGEFAQLLNARRVVAKRATTFALKAAVEAARRGDCEQARKRVGDLRTAARRIADSAEAPWWNEGGGATQLEVSIEQGADAVESECSERSGGWQQTAALSVAGVGAALVLGAALLELSHLDTVDEFESSRDRCAQTGAVTDCRQARSLGDEIDGAATTATALYVVGALAVGGGLTWYFWQPSSDRAPAGGVTVALVTGGALLVLDLAWESSAP